MRWLFCFIFAIKRKILVKNEIRKRYRRESEGKMFYLCVKLCLGRIKGIDKLRFYEDNKLKMILKK